MIQIFKTKQLFLLSAFLMATTTPTWADDDENYKFEETFNSMELDKLVLVKGDHNPWTYTGYAKPIYCYLANCIQIADKKNNSGSLTTPLLSGMPTYSLMTFKVIGDVANAKLSISGTDCIISPSSLNGLPTQNWYECTAYISVTGDEPRISFSAEANMPVILDDIKIVYGGTTLDVNITDAKYATLYFRRALDFSSTSISAYTAKAESDKVVLTKIEDGIVPANTGIVLYSNTTGIQQVPFTITNKTLTDNEMAGVYTDTKIKMTDGTYTNYILSNGTEGVGFYQATEEGAMLQANRAYLHTTKTVNARALSFEFDDTTTGISTTLNNEEETTSNHEIYNLNGMRVAHPTKGLYIVRSAKGRVHGKNVKKVIIK